MFPDARLSLRQEGDEIVVATDRFAHCVELTGDDDGDEFGWFFEDNYFNLLPFEEKRVRVMGRHDSGEIFARAHYAEQGARLHYERSNRS